MGKIKAQKHHGVKDPELQKLRRFEKIKDKINDPPKDPDHQHIPKSVTKLAHLMERTRQNQIQKHKKKKQKHLTKAFFEGIGVEITQNKKESDTNFLNRVNSACSRVIQEQRFQEKYKVKVERDPETGTVKGLVKQPKATQTSKDKGKVKKKGNNKQTITNVDKKMDRKTLKKIKQQEKEEEKKENERFEEIKFGEVAHAPPNLNIPKKISKIRNATKPGTRNLLLKNVIDTHKNSKQTKNKPEQKQKSQILDKTGKRKNLPLALRRKLENDQKDIVNAYRKLKQKKGK